jgi:tripartite-type tricarboxylate transporter receptor subunit TctC
MIFRSGYVGLLLLVFTASNALAQAYPERPIRLVVPFSPGGFSDIAARTIGVALSKSLGVGVIVDNRAGAGGLIGAEFVAKAAPDGYTLLLGSNGPVTVGPALYPNVPYDPIKSFAAISSLGVSPITLEVHPSMPVKTVAEFVAYLKANPGKVTVASPGIGTSSHLAAELFQLVTDTKMVHVPYKGSGPEMIDLVSGTVNCSFDPLSSSLANIQAGKLRPLAVTTLTRAPSLPDVPTLDEAGVKGYEASTWVALLAPAGTPRAIIDKLNAATRNALTEAAVKESFAKFATTPLGGTPEELTAFLKDDYAKWSRVIKQANIKSE